MKWLVDSRNESSGVWRIRYDDGTPNGDPNRRPLAEVYDLEVAARIVKDHNSIEEFQEYIRSIIRGV